MNDSWEIEAETLQAALASGEDILLLDCREPDECEIVRFPKALELPMREIPERVGELEPHRRRAIVVACHHGGRSLRVTHWLRGQGFPNVRSLAGGIDAWAERIDPTLARY